MKKVAVFHYTQSGQAAEIANNLCRSFSLCQTTNENPIVVVNKEIIPEKSFPFPWDRKPFFDIFPETRLGILPFGIKEIELSDVMDADLVIVVGQTWFLSPSVPIQAFFSDPKVRSFLKGKKVVFVNGCRNMWLMTFRKIREYVAEAGAKFVGHIVLQDRHANLISVLTIVRWLMYGKKNAGFLPHAGVSDKDICGSAVFGEIIAKALLTNDTENLQERLMEKGAIDYKPSVLRLEKTGHRLFEYWAKFIRRKGEYGDPRRETRCTMFFYYLLFVLYIVSPFVSLLYWLTYPLHPIKRQRQEDCYNLNQNK